MGSLSFRLPISRRFSSSLAESRMASAQLKASAAANFFAPRTRRNMPSQNYARIECPQFNPQNPSRVRPNPSITPAPSSTPTTSAPSPPAPSSPLPTGEDTIICAPPGHPDYELDDDIPDADTLEPLLNSSYITPAEKTELIKKWADNK
ncbi:hypothetical protein BKA64DRAFT_635998 [Cadophora sp. MPI-SDFR-AT-0126]|nr:hypothetical protein BKA64DRAFT_635998 [Leotiomycetes sp. MPI-SDFR-AT-0126]